MISMPPVIKLTNADRGSEEIKLFANIKMKKMKKTFLVLLVTCIAFAAMSQQTLYLTKPLANESVKNVEAKTSGGSIDIAGGYSQDARIEVYVSPNGHRISLSKEEIDTRIKEDYDFTVSVANNKLTAIVKAKHNFINWKNALSVSFKIFVPQNVSSDLATSGGSISLNNLSGTEEFRTSGGSLTVEKLTGKIDGETSGGSIHVSDSKDDIELGTSGGSIGANNCSGKIRLNTSGGSLTLHDLKGDIKATTSGGPVNAKNIGGELITSTSGGNVDLHALSCSVDASTSGGNINVEIINPGKYVKLNNPGGNIDLQIPGDKGYDLRLYAEKINTESFKHFSGSIKEKKIEGSLNGGGIEVMADAGGGKINLSFH
jgi:hypothetical protein